MILGDNFFMVKVCKNIKMYKSKAGKNIVA